MNRNRQNQESRLVRLFKLEKLLDQGVTDRKRLARLLGVSERQIHRDMHVVAKADGGPSSLVQRRRNRVLKKGTGSEQ